MLEEEEKGGGGRVNHRWANPNPLATQIRK
jgi:hypothetical protein